MGVNLIALLIEKKNPVPAALNGVHGVSDSTKIIMNNYHYGKPQ